MIAKSRIALNRIARPSSTLGGFFELASSLGITKVELRNDLPGRPGSSGVVDGLPYEEAARLAREWGVRVVTINALQKFNLASVRKTALQELEELLELCAAIDCPALVLCPNNDAGDSRAPAVRYAETVEALRRYGPLFARYGVAGCIEPLGFGISSLASLPVAAKAAEESGFGCYRVVHDTFHHHIGPDSAAMYGAGGLGAPFPMAYLGLVHVSGVESAIPAGEYRDAHRIMPGPGDLMKSREQMRTMDALGYLGDYSFEPFSAEVQSLGDEEFEKVFEESVRYLCE